MHRYTKIGLSLIFISFLMWLLVVSYFSSNAVINPILNFVLEISFAIWLPTLIVGLFFLIRSKNKKDPK